MKVVLVLDGERREVEADLDRRTLRVGDHEWPFQLLSSGDGVVSFEILGERVDVHEEKSPGEPALRGVVINGELHRYAVESRAGAAPHPTAARAAGPSPGGPSTPGAGPAPTGPGAAIVPPMPGKVLDVRVRNGEVVQPGQVLLVLEAMKMRNEVTSPVAGVVTGLAVSAGANVSAREVLLRVVPPTG